MAARFGGFEFDLSSRELRKGQTRLRVPDQSLEILAMLLERPGELVTRESIQARLWPNGTVVEFELTDTGALLRKGYRGLRPVDRVRGILKRTRSTDAIIDDMRGAAPARKDRH